MAKWNPWHGCEKISAGCLHCYVYRMDERHGRDARQVQKTGEFDLPLRKNRQGGYKISAGETVYTCFTSDFLLPAADEWRGQAWQMMRQRQDLRFLFITKRIDRFCQVLPPDWGAGYENVAIGSTVENQDRADARLPVFLAAPIAHRLIICEPLLEALDLSPYLDERVEGVVAGGESGPEARLCRFAWIAQLRSQCVQARVPFTFKQTGARFEKDGKIYWVRRAEQHSQAKKAGMDWPGWTR